MELVFEEEKTFDKSDFTESNLAKGEYNLCKFSGCNFSNSDLKDIKFYECEFINCNLSLAKLTNTIFRDVQFKDCKMLGLPFDNCNEFGLTVGFENCNLNHSSFYRKRMAKTIFRNSQLVEVDFTDCDLSQALFANCNLSDAKFENTNLEKADLRLAHHYSINPAFNKIKKARFSLTGVVGLLNQYDIEIDMTN